jgi:hypothetical protein
MKSHVERIKSGSIVVAYLKQLIAELGAIGGVIMVVAHKLHLLAGLPKKAVVGNERPILQSATIGLNNLTTGKQGDELSPVEAGVIEKNDSRRPSGLG